MPEEVRLIDLFTHRKVGEIIKWVCKDSDRCTKVMWEGLLEVGEKQFLTDIARNRFNEHEQLFLRVRNIIY